MKYHDSIPTYDKIPAPADRQPKEDRALKAAAQFLGEELLAELGIEGTMKRIAPTEQVYLNLKDLNEDFNYEMTDGSWKHLEFESDRITDDDLRRFRTYEAVTSYQYKVPVTTYVLCSSNVRHLKQELTQGINTYRIKVIRLKDRDADQLIRTLEQKQTVGSLNRKELLSLLLAPLMNGTLSQPERIRRGLQILQKEQRQIPPDDLTRMQAVLYTLAMKFLTTAELEKIKEVFTMTILGQMIEEMGIEKGTKQGQNRVNQLNQHLINTNRLDDMIKSASDTEYQKKLFAEFNL